MSEFKPIETQEALDAIIKERLERNTRSVTDKVTEEFNEKLAGLSEVTTQRDELKANLESLQTELDTLKANGEANGAALTEKDAQIAEMQSRLAKYETDSVKREIAKQYGIPLEFAERLQGGDEEAIRKDAENLAGSLKSFGGASPRRNPEAGGIDDGVIAAFKKINPNLKF